MGARYEIVFQVMVLSGEIPLKLLSMESSEHLHCTFVLVLSELLAAATFTSEALQANYR
jgi:hypothetical protein